MADWDVREIYFNVPRDSKSAVDLWFLHDPHQVPGQPCVPDFYSCCVLDLGSDGEDDDWISKAMRYGEFAHADANTNETNNENEQSWVDIAILSAEPSRFDGAIQARNDKRQEPLPPLKPFLMQQGFDYVTYPAPNAATPNSFLEAAQHLVKPCRVEDLPDV